MYNDSDLINHVESASSIETGSFVYAEINMNDATNIDLIGNYKNRPSTNATIKSAFEKESEETGVANRAYFGFTNSDIVIDGGTDVTGQPAAFISQDAKAKMLFSLEECFGKFRPRSGINKLVFFPGRSTHNVTRTLMSRPRYYVADKDDKFKYWTSFRIQQTPPKEYAVSAITATRVEHTYDLDAVDQYPDPDSPNTTITTIKYYTTTLTIDFTESHTFEVNEAIRLWGLTGTGVEHNGSYTVASIVDSNTITVESLVDSDAFPIVSATTATVSGRTESTERGIANVKVSQKDEYYIDDTAPFVVYKEKIPVNRIVVKMQTHVGTQKTYNMPSTTADPLFEEEASIQNRMVPIDWDIQYLNKDDVWTTLASFDSTNNATKPMIPRDGYVELHYSNGSWSLGSEGLEASTPLITELTDATNIDAEKFKEFMLIRGLRIVVNTMSKPGATFDLIELSPRLAIDLSSVTKSFTLTKTASDLGSSGMPVGQLLASQGSLSLSDYNDEFNPEKGIVRTANTQNPYGVTNLSGSVIAKYVRKGVQIKFYEIVKNILVDNAYVDSYIPLKTMYIEQFPDFASAQKDVSIKLRDTYYYLEELIAPELLLENISLSYAIALVLDSIGFTNYVYLRSPNDEDPIIKHFYIPKKTRVATLLQDLAVSTQTAMFFDEYNNLVLMSKRYMMPEIGEGDRETEYDTILIGTASDNKQPNIVEISKNDSQIYNDGVIKFTERYIKREVSKVYPAPLTSETGKPQQRLVLPNEQKWVYASALLWQPSSPEEMRPTGGGNNSQSGETLAAMPLKSNLPADPPTVLNGEVINNIISFGEAIYWLPRYNGYFHANGEIIKYDAVQYSVSGHGDVWISSAREFTQYFADLAYKGKIYPTGNVRIFAEPRYTKDSQGNVILKDGPVDRHGRGQFGTAIVSHVGVLDSTHWTMNKENVGGIEMMSDLLFADNYVTEVSISGVTISGGKTVTIPSDKKNYIIKDQAVSGTGVAASTTVKSIATIASNKFTISKNATNGSGKTIKLSGKKIYNSSLVSVQEGPAGLTYSDKALSSSRTNVVRNYMAGTYNSETSTNSVLSSSTLQSSALVFTGPEFSSTSGETVKPLDYVSYVYKDLANTDAKMTSAHKHFGTRMRIIGHDAADPSLAASTGATSIFANAKLSGSSGGMGIMVDPETNNGYFLELIALTDENMAAYKSDNKNDNDLAESIFNVVLYKTCKQKDVNANNVLVNTITNIKVNNKTSKRLTYYVKNSSITVGDTVTVTGTGWNTSGKVIARGTDYVVLKYNGAKSLSSYSNGDVVSGDKTGTLSISGKAVPLKLWSGMAQILTDNGQFVGQQRLTGQDNPTVYDIALEYEDAKDSKGDTVGLKFFIYINNNLVGTTIDLEPIKTRKNTVALFVRGSSRVMFEHVYALGADESTNYRNSSYAPFKDNLNLNLETNTDSAFGKYSMPKAIQTTYFKGLSPIAPPAYGMFYDEFGTIMREAKYYDITFDKAYPVFRSMIAPSYNPIKGYAVSGYVSTPYGAEFMVFNTMDSTLVFGDNQNPLNIIGLVFTDQTDKNYSMDDHLSKMSDFSKYDMLEDNSYSSVAFNPSLSKKIFQNVKNSRNTYGRSAFSIDATYIQTQDDAERIMEWMLAKLSTPKKSIGVKVFGVPYIQLGDIVKIHHKDNGENFVDPENLFVVYSMDYSTNDRGPETTLYLSEVSTSA